MIPTPRTDAFFRPDAQEYPAAKFARKLERESIELLEALEELVSHSATQPSTKEGVRRQKTAVTKAIEAIAKAKSSL